MSRAHRLGGRTVVEPAHRHVRALARQRPGDGRPDALLGARYQSHFACQFHAKIPRQMGILPDPGVLARTGPPLYKPRSFKRLGQ